MGGGGGVGGHIWLFAALWCGICLLFFPTDFSKESTSEADVSNHLGCRVFLSLQRCPGSADGGMMAAVLRL